MKRILCALITVVSAYAYTHAFDYVVIAGTGPFIEWTSSESKPSKGATWIDSNSGVTGYRVTASTSESMTDGGVCTEYTFSCESSDGNLLVFVGALAINNINNDGYYLYTTTTSVPTMVRDISTLVGYAAETDGDQPEVRFDQSGEHPTWLYFRNHMVLKYLDCSDWSVHTVHDFGDDFPAHEAAGWFIKMGDEGDPSENSQYWAFKLNINSTDPGIIFTYDKTLDVVVSSVAYSYAPNSVYVSKSGNYVITSTLWNTDDIPQFSGTWAWNFKTMSSATAKYMLSTSKHHAPAYSKQGNDVLVFEGNSENYTEYFQFVRMSDGESFPLCHQGDMGWDLDNQWHAPGYSRRGWCFWSPYTVSDSPGWGGYQVIAFELDETRTSTTTVKNRMWRIGSNQDRCNTNYYMNQPNVNINNSGTRVYFCSNWRNKATPMEVYRYNLPLTWYTDFGYTEDQQQSATINNVGYITVNSATGMNVSVMDIR